MKKIIFIVAIALTTLAACNQSSKKSDETKINETVQNAEHVKLQVYYFHLTNRCITCNAIENHTKQLLDSLFAKELAEGSIVFSSINIQEKENWDISEKYQTANSSLFITAYKDGKEITKDLTNQAFSYARNQPEVFKSVLQESIQELLQ